MSEAQQLYREMLAWIPKHHLERGMGDGVVWMMVVCPGRQLNCAVLRVWRIMSNMHGNEPLAEGDVRDGWQSEFWHAWEWAYRFVSTNGNS